MKIAAIMPIKLKNERCPGKNTKILGDKPLLKYELDNLKKTKLCDSINVYCSDDSIIPFLPSLKDPYIWTCRHQISRRFLTALLTP